MFLKRREFGEYFDYAYTKLLSCAIPSAYDRYMRCGNLLFRASDAVEIKKNGLAVRALMELN